MDLGRHIAMLTTTVYGLVSFPLSKNPDSNRNLRKREHPTYSTQLESTDSLSYTMNVTIGGQVFPLVIDTGSSNLWVSGKNCAGCSANLSTYDPSKSKTDPQLTNKTLHIGYGKGIFYGRVYEDEIEFSGLPPIRTQFGMSTNNSGFPPSQEGIFGLGFQDSASDNIITPMNLMAQKYDIPNIVGIRLPDYSNENGEIVFGGYNKDKFKGDITYVPVKPKNSYLGLPNGNITNVTRWSVKADDLHINGSSIFLFKDQLVTLDSGSSYMIFPTDVANELAKSISAFVDVQNHTKGSSTSYTVNCTSTHSLPEFTFIFNNTPFTLRYEDYVFPQTENISEACHLQFSGLENTDGTFLLGDTFMRKYYTIFDTKNSRIGFAKNKN